MAPPEDRTSRPGIYPSQAAGALTVGRSSDPSNISRPYFAPAPAPDGSGVLTSAESS